MALNQGTRIGPYEIVGLLGKGGMGEVYKGHDPRLGRDVAIKVVSGKFASDPEGLRRFEGEARAAAALSHPNILSIFDVGTEGGMPYLVAEYLEGQTLRATLNDGPIPFSRSLEIACGIASGLTAAHARGIAHRDLKPENVFLTVDGRVKILDFGIAKWIKSSTTDHAAETVAQTHAGAILGTVGYMAPEQATGREVDCRCDQFAFGVLVYEMLSGRRAFERPSQVEELAAICRDEPPQISELRPEAPLPLQWLLTRCLAKNPAERYESTRDLHRDLETLTTHMQAPAPPRPKPAESSKLPVPRTPLIGRETAVATALQIVRRETARLVTFTGPGGIGKSRLALQVVLELRDEFPGGVYFAPLATISDAHLVPQAVAQACGVRGAESPLQALTELLAHASGPTLLMLDSFEHLLAAVPFVAELLGFGAPLKVLVTSREPLHLYEEHEVPVVPLPRPDLSSTTSLDTLARNAAVALFVERATASKPDFKLTSENARTIAEICNRLDGLPLAVELAAARVKTLPPSAMLGRMESRLQILTGGARDLPARQQTLRGAIAWSHDLLGEPEQRLFRRLSVFVGGCTFEAAEAVSDARQDLGIDVLDGIDSLVNKSLVQLSEQPDGEARIQMMETIREFARERLIDGGEEPLVRKAHAAYYLVLAEEAAPALQGPDQALWVERLDRDRDNIRTALDWLLTSRNAAWGMRLATALARYWEIRELFVEGRRWLTPLLALPGAQPRTAARAKAVFGLGLTAGAQRDHENGQALFGEALAIYRELGDKQGMAVALNALAVGHKDVGEFADARRLLEEASLLWLELGDRLMQARTVSNLAAITRDQGDLDAAHERYQEALELFQRLGDREGVAWSLRHLGDIARSRRNHAQAELFYLESLAVFEELTDAWSAGSVLTDLGTLALLEGDRTGGLERLKQAVAALRELGGHKRGLARVLEGFAFAASRNGNPRKAITLSAAAAALRNAIGAALTPWEQQQMAGGVEGTEALAASDRTRAWSEGWTMSLDEAIEFALAD